MTISHDMEPERQYNSNWDIQEFAKALGVKNYILTEQPMIELPQTPPVEDTIARLASELSSTTQCVWDATNHIYDCMANSIPIQVSVVEKYNLALINNAKARAHLIRFIHNNETPR